MTELRPKQWSPWRWVIKRRFNLLQPKRYEFRILEVWLFTNFFWGFLLNRQNCLKVPIDYSKFIILWIPSPQSNNQLSEPVVVGINNSSALATKINHSINSILLPLRKELRIAPVPKNVRMSPLLAIKIIYFWDW